MNSLFIDATDDTPEVILDKDGGRFFFGGKSMPEDVKEFYSPIITWLQEYIESSNAETRVVFKLEYFNSASAKQVLEILACFETVSKNGNTVEVDWHYLDEDEDMKDAGESYASLVDLPINMIVYQ